MVDPNYNPAEIPTAEAIAEFQDMLAQHRDEQTRRIEHAQAKRERRAARNLMQSHRCLGGGRCRGNVAS